MIAGGYSWGPRRIADDEVVFRLWADGQDSLSLIVGSAAVPMQPAGNGWFEASVRGVMPGAPYGFRLADGLEVPDPASRLQLADVHGRSLVPDPKSYRWKIEWHGRPWHETVIYELHIGTFTSEGTFRAAIEKLDHLVELGVTAIEIMPIAQFSGRRGWGYDGVLPYAPHNCYGSPDDLKAVVDAAHERGLMVLLDVVYNHFGPDGNYLGAFAPGFFDADRDTPWGPGIAYDKAAVRAFFIENAIYWLGEFNLDGLRLDAIDQIVDRSDKHILVELAERVRATFADRHIHLTTEDNRNVTMLHEREDELIPLYNGEWNDDFHNAAHVIATGESEGYYIDFADRPVDHLARCLAEGFAFQGEESKHAGAARGTTSRHLPATSFVNFLQNHDQVGNRALGERLGQIVAPRVVRALTAILLLSPSIPLLFMGEEFAADTPFYFFTDFQGDLGRAVREGRRQEFAGFAAFSADPEAIPDPNAHTTFFASRLDWAKTTDAAGGEMMTFYRTLLAIRKREIVPLLADASGEAGSSVSNAAPILAVDWQLGGKTLALRANLGDVPRAVPDAPGDVIFALSEPVADPASRIREMAPWDVVWTVTRTAGLGTR